MWPLFSVALVVGGLVGLLNAILTDNRHVWPRLTRSPPGIRLVVRPGLAGNVVLGAVAPSLCLWGLVIGSGQPLFVHTMTVG